MNNKERLFRAATIATFLMAGCSTVPKTRAGQGYDNNIRIVWTPTVIPFLPDLEQTLGPTPLPPTETSTEIIYPYKMFGIDFSDFSKEIDIQIDLSQGSSFKVNSFASFLCGPIYAPGNHFSCDYQLQDRNPEDLLHFVHSGYVNQGQIKLEAEDIRHFLEDSPGSWDKRLAPDQIQKNMDMFIEADVSITQGDIEAKNLKVLAMVRVPPDKLGPFSHNPYVQGPEGQKVLLTNENIFSTLATIDPSISDYEKDGKAQIVIIFCGWNNPAEKDLVGVDPYDAADFYQAVRYAIILGE